MLENNFYTYACFSRLFRIKYYDSSDTRKKALVLILKGINYLVILCSSKLVFRLKIFLSVAEDKLNFVTLVAQPQHGSPQMTLGLHCSEALQKMR